MDLRSALVGLGEYLVQHHGFSKTELAGSKHLAKTTTPVMTFREWLLNTPQTSTYLAEVGIPTFHRVLSDLADYLLSRGYGREKRTGVGLPAHTTTPIVVFLIWLNDAHEARHWLGEKYFIKPPVCSPDDFPAAAYNGLVKGGAYHDTKTHPDKGTVGGSPRTAGKSERAATPCLGH